MFFKGKRVLVTGGSGVIGKELIKFLIGQKAIIRCVDIVEKPENFDGIEYYRLDLSKPDQQFLFRYEPEYVFHLAADFERSEETEQFWDSNFYNNIMASHYIIENVIKTPKLKKIIFSSSYLIYDKSIYNNAEKINYLNEKSQINPRNLCGIAKLQTESDIEFLGKIKDFSFISARIFRVYGLGSRDIITRWIKDILSGKPIKLFSENNRFDYVFARDVAEGLLRMGMSDKNGIYNLGTGKPTKIKEIFVILKKILGNFEVIRTNDLIYEESSCADLTKLKRDFDWTPKIEILEGIKEIIEYEKNEVL